MAIDRFNYSPDEVFNSATSYPDPIGEAQVREQLSRPHKQLEEYINNKLLPSIESGINGANSNANNAVQAEQTRATSAEAILKDDIANVNSRLNSETSRATAAEQANSNAVQAEQTRARSAEASLSEANAKSYSDIDRKINDISASMAYGLAIEIARAKAKETVILDKSDRGVNAISVDLSNEISRAKGAENNIAALLNALGLSVVNGKVCQTVKGE